VDVSVLEGQRQGSVGELSVSDQFEFADAHDWSLALKWINHCPGLHGPSA
jgi:hypothetical protein